MKPPTTTQRIEAFAAELGISPRTAWTWFRQGCPVNDTAAARQWASRRGKNAASSPEIAAKRAVLVGEQVRRLKIANDGQESRMVPRSWLAERMRRAMRELNAIRATLEPKQAASIAAAGANVPDTRAAVRAAWDEIFAAVQELQRHFEE